MRHFTSTCANNYEVTLAYLWEQETWVPALQLDKLSTSYGHVGNSGEVRARELARTTRSALPATTIRSNANAVPRSGLTPASCTLWDRHAQHIRWMIAAAGTITIAQAAFDAAIANWPGERFTLRQGIMLIREHPRD
jgi:hypothetical protein